MPLSGSSNAIVNLLKERIRYGSHRFGDTFSIFVCFAIFPHFSHSLLALCMKKVLLVYIGVCYLFFHLPWQFDKKFNKKFARLKYLLPNSLYWLFGPFPDKHLLQMHVCIKTLQFWMYTLSLKTILQNFAEKLLSREYFGGE